jgi:class 3 adenylate cyclase
VVPAGRPAAATEFRQITFMYVDLVASTALSEILEPESYSDMILRYRDAVGPAITDNGGLIVHFSGDGILAYFGYPKAASDDAARAVRAGLQAMEALRPHTVVAPDGSAVALEARIGIHTGMTVIGDLESAGLVEENAAIGRAANLAARVQAAALPGQVAISDVTLRLVDAHFHVRPIGSMTLKGVTNPMTLHEVIAPTNVSAGFRRPLHVDAVARGRESEHTVLRERWRDAGLSHGSAILVSGEAGIGKSRLVHDFLDENDVRRTGKVLFVECLEQRRNSAFQPLRDALATAVGPATERIPAAFERQLGRAFALAAPHLVRLSHFLLGTVADTSISPSKSREDLIDALLAWLEAEQMDRPLALVVEDLHWADESTLMLLERVLSLADSMKLLVLMTARDELAAAIAGDFHLNRLRLTPLDPTDARLVLLDSARGQTVPEGALHLLVQRAGGNPLFLEELAHNWFEKSGETAGTLVEAVPPSLRDALMERIDRAGSAKRTAQFAAVLGQTFPVALLEACDERNAADMRRDLARLVDTSIVRRRAGVTTEEYEFRHALVREVALDSVLPRTQTMYHRRIAEVISTRFPEMAKMRPEVLAWHLENGGQPNDAIDAWLKAGQGAATHSANAEALAHFRRCLALLRQADESVHGRRERMLDVLLAMGGPLIAQHGWAADPVDATYREAIDICESLGDEGKLFNVLRGRQNVLLLRGDLKTCKAISLDLLQMAERRSDDTLVMEARRGLGVCAFLAGQFDEAITELDRVIDLFDPERHDGLAAVYGANPGVVALSWRAWASCFVGQPRSAFEHIERATVAARRAKHPFSEGYALCFAASIHQCNGDVANALRYGDLAVELARQRGYPYWQAWAGIVRGWARGAAGNAMEGLQELLESLAEYDALGARMIVAYAHALAADIAIRGEAADLARHHLLAAEDSVRETGMSYCESLLDAVRERLGAADRAS